jgi:lipooligosaccharide transport system ATP-binding protein
MDEAEQLCDRLVIMDGGRIVAEGSPRSLIERHTTRDVVELRFDDAERREKATAVLESSGQRVEALTDRVLVYTDNGDDVAPALMEHTLHAESVLVRRATLEDVFLILTGRSLEEG